MLPDPIFLNVHMYGVMIAVGILAAFAVLHFYCKKNKVGSRFEDFLFYDSIASIFVGFGSAALFQALYDYIENPAGGFHIGSGITFLGGFIGGAVCFLGIYFIFRKKLKGRFMDVISVIPCAITIAHGFGRIGCFFAGCCYGKETDSFLSVKFPNLPNPVYPTQLFEAGFLFVLFAVLSVLTLRTKTKYGLSIYFISYGTFRFFIEFIRDDHRGTFLGNISPSQFWSVALVILGIILIFPTAYFAKKRSSQLNAQSHFWISNTDISEKETEKISAKITVTPEYTENLTLSGKIPCRDPYIMNFGGKYYLYSGGTPEGIFCSVSEDLEHWSDKIRVFEVPEGFHGTADFFWAPECHYYNGKFYIFTSVYSSEINHRAISVYMADNPLGPFTDIAGGCITPKDWDCIDGTLYIDEQDNPWMIFVHEWTSMPDGNGAMVAARLSENFNKFVSKPVQLFLARDWKPATAGVTDAPYLYRTEKGKLYMTWSNFRNGYVILQAVSESGSIFGPWEQCEEPVYETGLKEGFEKEGGHAMIFKTNEGKFMITFHTPNSRSEEDFEHVCLMEVTLDEDGVHFTGK